MSQVNKVPFPSSSVVKVWLVKDVYVPEERLQLMHVRKKNEIKQKEVKVVTGLEPATCGCSKMPSDETNFIEDHHYYQLSYTTLSSRFMQLLQSYSHATVEKFHFAFNSAFTQKPSG